MTLTLEDLLFCLTEVKLKIIEIIACIESEEQANVYGIDLWFSASLWVATPYGQMTLSWRSNITYPEYHLFIL